MPSGLNVARLINIQASLAPLAAAAPGYGVLLIIGDSGRIDEIQSYTSIDEVLEDFELNDPEYEAAALYFGQSPRPRLLQIAPFAGAAIAGKLRGGGLSAGQKALANFTAIDDGAFTIEVDGAEQTADGLDFSGAANLNAVAALITAGLVGASCAWDGTRFTVTSATTGALSTVGFATEAGAGTELFEILRLNDPAATEIPGVAAGTPVAAVIAHAAASGVWYAGMFASGVMPTDDQCVAIAEYIQGTGASLPRIFGFTNANEAMLDGDDETDLAFRLKAREYDRSCVLFSRDNAFAFASFAGRAFSVDFTADDSTITMAYKRLPGVLPETLTETEAQALETKRANVYVNYNNGKAIVQFGVMSGEAYFDERHELDWFVGTLQNAIFNRLYQAKRKIPQTNAGMHELVNVASSVCAMARKNGMIAGGQWNADGFGTLEFGSPLPTGSYIYAPLMEDQDQAEREQRIAPTMQIALKLAGAVHRANVIVDVNR